MQGRQKTRNCYFWSLIVCSIYGTDIYTNRTWSCRTQFKTTKCINLKYKQFIFKEILNKTLEIINRVGKVRKKTISWFEFMTTYFIPNNWKHNILICSSTIQTEGFDLIKYSNWQQFHHKRKLTLIDVPNLISFYG